MKLSSFILSAALLMAYPCQDLVMPASAHAITKKHKSVAGGPIVAIDHNGKIIGTLFGAGLGNSTQLAVRKLPDGTVVTLPVSVQGFVDEATTGSVGFLTLWYPTTDCSGPGSITLGTGFDPRTNQPLDIVPLVQETTDGGAIATYVYNNVLFYAAQPLELITFNSYAACTDPVQCPNDPVLGGCQPLFKPQTQMGGSMTSFDLGSLNFIPPFQVQP